MTVQVVTIHRKRKSEAEQAIKDLQARGYEIVGELKNAKDSRKTFVPNENRRLVFDDTVMWDSWYCRMRRVVND